MRKSDVGKETTFLWEGFRRPEEISLIQTDSTPHISGKIHRKIERDWRKIKEKHPHAFDGHKWRTEFVHDDESRLNIYVSETRYSEHNVMRNFTGKPMGFYPNPLTINTVQETADGYILIGVRGKTSDQKGLGLIGAGFVDRYLGKDCRSKEPEGLGYVVQRECLEETKYNCNRYFDMTDARAMSVIFGSNHDTTVGFYLPIFATSKQVELGNDEHSDLLFADEGDVPKILAEGGYKGIPAADDMLGCLESYMKNLDADKIKRRRR